MHKRIKTVVTVMVLSVLLTGCKSTNYNDAKTAIQNKDYEVAFELLVDLGDYKDSQQILIDNIIVYVSSLVENDDYDNGIAILDTYQSVSDFSELYNQITEEKVLYDTYIQAEECFMDDDIEEGFALLDTLPSDYRNIQNVYDTYERLKDTPFKGNHRDGTTGEVSQSIKFGLSYSSYEDAFQLHVDKKIYWSDGTVYKEHDFYIDAEDIEGNTIKYGSYTWTMNNGKLTEIEKGETYTYR